MKKFIGLHHGHLIQFVVLPLIILIDLSFFQMVVVVALSALYSLQVTQYQYVKDIDKLNSKMFESIVKILSKK